MKRKKLGLLDSFFMVMIDAILINAGYILAFKIRFGYLPVENYNDYMRMIPWIVVLTFFFFKIYGLYDLYRKSFADVAFSAALSVIMIMAFTVVLTFFYRGFAFPRSVFLIGALIQFLLTLLWKTFCLLSIKRIHGVKKVVLVGSKEEAYEVAHKFKNISDGWFEAKYVIDEDNIDMIYDVMQEVDILCLCPGLSQELKSEISITALEKKKKIFLVPDMYELFLSKSNFTRIDDIPVFELTDITLSFDQIVLKRFFDILFSITGLLIAFIPMVVISFFIKMTSPGPVLYCQKRVGQYGKPFILYKFRTMIDGAEKDTGPVLATDNDPRITPIGRFLRATRLDELPQLINVLKGDMSLVGPRPERPFFVEKINEENPHYKYRHIIKPGITGLAQVMAKYTTCAEDKLRYDIMYIRNYSMLLDIRILFYTLKVIFIKDSARGCREIDYASDISKEIKIITHETIAASREK